MKATGNLSPLMAFAGLLLLSTPLLAQPPGAPAPRRLGPAMDIADAPVPKVANPRARESFDRARQSLQRVRSLNQAANSRRQEAAQSGGETPNVRPPVRPKPVKPR